MHAVSPRNHAVDVLGGATMGTTWSVKLVASAHTDLHALHGGIQAQLDRVIAQMSNWEADSNLSRYNASAPGSWHALPDGFWTVLSGAMHIARTSGGAYDPTVGPLVDAWGFGPRGRCDGIPSSDQARAHVGWERVILDPDSRSALQPGGTRLDLCAIAKGYAVDEVATHLRTSGVGSALVEVGGELYGYGHKPDRTPWRVIVEGWSGDEDDAREPRILALDGHAVATSGDRWHRHRIDGRDVSHTLDPRTGAPVQNAPTAVTVVAADAMHADGWATALTVLGMREGYDFACAHALAARFVDAREGTQFEERMTPAFEALLSS